MKNFEPNFFLVGAAKAGTTALHRFLTAHPQIYMSPIKETNYFSQPDMKQDQFLRNYQNSVDFNIDNYLTGPMNKIIHSANIQKWDDYIRLFNNVNMETAIGEASNSYLFCPSAPKQIAARIPNAKILMILRNPIERVWSHYLMNRRIGYTLASNFIDEFGRDSNKKTPGWGVTHNYRELGMYSSQLERYYSVFPTDQLKIIIYDDYYKSPQLILKSIFGFLGVDTTIEIDFTGKENQSALPRFPKLNYLLLRSGLTGRLKRRSSPAIVSLAEKLLFTSSVLPTLKRTERTFLRDIYRDDINKVSVLLQRDLRIWTED